MPAMKPDELDTFVKACDSAVWFHQRALTFDKSVELKRAKLFSDFE